MSAGENPVVAIAAGRIEGSVGPDGAVRSFRGIPYAEPPFGPLRWAPPQPVSPWDGVRPAREFGPSAPQPPIAADSMFAVAHEPQSEDCLYLNVWTAASDPGERRPTIVWLHYGGFIIGGGADPIFDGTVLAQEGAVVVTINYRLGRLGYLAHPWLSAESESASSGNYGLLDQIAALEWVRDNIAAFGGDPDCVTLAGLSAGSASVSMLMASPRARGLFHRAAGLSGGIFGSWRPPGIGDSLETLELAEAAGERVVGALGSIDLEELRALPVAALDGLRLPVPEGAPKFVFPPLGDAAPGPGSGAHPIRDGNVLPADPFDAFGRSEQIDVPLITGSAREEKAGMPYLRSAGELIGFAEHVYGPDAARFLELYPAGSDAEAIDSSARSMADRIFVWQNWTWARVHARTAGAETFYYHTSREPPVPRDGTYPERDPGAFHTGEAFYLFGSFEAKPWDWTEADREAGRTLRGYVLNFARHGDPNGAGLVAWRPFDPDAPAAMVFGDGPPAPGEVPRPDHLAFWDRYYERP